MNPLQSAVGRLRWPLPAVLAWATGWAACVLAARLAWPPAAGFALGVTLSAALAWPCSGNWRRGIAAAGFPLSALALGAAGAWPAWVWLLLLLPLLAAYPLRAWRDAPFFPTPHNALEGLDAVVGSPARVLDAGCGLGHGLMALRRLWPQAALAGLEWSPPLALLAAWRCRTFGARVQRGDMWAASWAGNDLVYVFQRPESMQRVFDKASRELSPRAWLVSLEFAVPGLAPVASLQGPGRRPVWIYRPVEQASSTLCQRLPDSIDGARCR
jgi:SAM-dependent methyltransferase